MYVASYWIEIACSKRSDGGEHCKVKKAIKRRGGLGRDLSPLLLPSFYFFALLFTSHRSALSKRLEQARIEKVSYLSCITKIVLVAKTMRLVMWERVQQ